MTEVPRTRERWKREFGEWYRSVLLEAEIADFRHPVKGCGALLPYGFRLRQNVLSIIRRLLDETGHQEVLFPQLIPEDALAKEAEHIKGFSGEVFWVTQGGERPLGIRLALRPTSEAVITPMVAMRARSHRHLPVKYYQVVNIFRFETKMTVPLIRDREVLTFKEAHTFHATHEEAERQIEEAISIYKRFFDELGIPYLISQRPEWDKFAGALRTISFDTIMPDGRTLQIATVHDLGQNFARAFEATFEKPDGTHEYYWQTSYGISGRVIAALIAIHGDDIGPCLPPTVAPIQAVIVPIPKKEFPQNRLLDYVRVLEERLRSKGVRVQSDLREDLTPGAKYYWWDRRGVPLRLDVGPREVETNTVVVVRRDTGARETVALERVVAELERMMQKMQADLRARAWAFLREYVHQPRSLEELRSLIAERRGVAEVPWCGDPDCGQELEEYSEAKLLGIALDREFETEQPCLVCGRPTRKVARIAKRY